MPEVGLRLVARQTGVRETLGGAQQQIRAIKAQAVEAQGAFDAWSRSAAAAAETTARDFRLTAEAGAAAVRQIVEQAKTDISASRARQTAIREYLGTIKAGTDEAAVAQRMLREEIGRTNALIGRQATEFRAAGTAAASSAAGRPLRREEALTGRESRGGLRGIVGQGFGAFASTGFIAGAGAGLEIKASLNAVRSYQDSLIQLQQTLRNQGGSWRDSGRELSGFTTRMIGLGFKVNDTRDSLNRFLVATRNVHEAERDAALAADIAANRHIALSAATQILTRVEAGHASGLSRFGIQAVKVTKYEDELKVAHIKVTDANRAAMLSLQEHAKAMDLAATRTANLALLQRRFAGDAVAASRTAGGENRRLSATFEEMQVVIGRALLPQMRQASKALSDWIERGLKTGSIQRSLRSLTDLAAVGFHLLTGAVHIGVDAFRLLERITGGAKQAIEALLIAMAVRKVGGFFTAMTQGWQRTGRAAVVSAAQQTAAAGESETAVSGGRFTRALSAIAGGWRSGGRAAQVSAAEQTAAAGEVEASAVAVGTTWELTLAGMTMAVRGFLASTLIGLLVVGFSLAATYVLTHWKQVQSWFETFYGWMKRVTRDTVDVLKGLFFGFVAAVMSQLGVLIDGLAKAFGWIPGGIGKSLKRAAGTFDSWTAEMRQKSVAAFQDIGAKSGQAFARSFNTAVQQANVTASGTAAAGGAIVLHRGGLVIGGTGGQGGIVGTAVSAAQSPNAAANSFHLPGERTPYDCSAFTQAVFRQNGIQIGGDTVAQYAGGRAVRRSDLQPGDLVFFDFPVDNKHPGHVGIYVGQGQIVHDHGSSGGVSLQSLAGMLTGGGRYVGARCYIAGHNHVGAGAADQGGTKPSASAAKVAAQQAAAFQASLAGAQRAAGATATHHRGRAGGHTGGRRTYSNQELQRLWADAGGPAHLANIAAAVALAESGGRSWATNHNTNGTVDYGCWQINSSHGYDAARLVSPSQTYNAQCAVDVYNAQGFDAWTTYRNGAYERHLRAEVSGLTSKAGGRAGGAATVTTIRGGLAATITAANTAVGRMLTPTGDETAAGIRPSISAATQTAIGTAEQHLRALEEALTPKMTPRRLAQLRLAIRRWQTALKAALGEALKETQVEAARAQTLLDRWFRDITNVGQQNYDDATNRQLTQMQRAFAARMTEFDNETERVANSIKVHVRTAYGAFEIQPGQQTPAEKMLADLQAQTATSDLAAQVGDAQAALARARIIGEPGAIRDAQRQLDDLLSQQQQQALQLRATAERTAADQAIQQAQDAYRARRDIEKQGLQDIETTRETAYQRQRAQQWQAMMDELDDLKTALGAKLVSWAQYQADVQAILAGQKPPYPFPGMPGGAAPASTGGARTTTAGMAVVGRTSTGAFGRIPEFQTGAYVRRRMLAQIGEVPEFVTPDAWLGPGLRAQLAAVHRAHHAPGSDALAAVTAGASLAAARSNGGAGPTFLWTGDVIVQGNVQKERDLAVSIRDHLVQQFAAQGGRGFAGTA